ncbi:MAG: TonB family protein, partial [Sphingobacteriaceae bacterium]
LREVAVNLTPQVNVLPGSLVELKLPITIVQKLKGKVVSINGEPLAGVEVLYGKKSINFTTDQDGSFVIINYAEGDFLTFAHTGYNTIAKSFTDVKGKLPIVVLQEGVANQYVKVVKGSVTTFTNVTQHSNDSSKAVSFVAVDKLPHFPGGESAFGNYLAKSIRYPKEAKDQKITGRVIVSFIVEKDGRLNDIKVLRDIGGGCGTEAVRVLSECPAWNPGIQDGKPVRVAYTMPVGFTLADVKNSSTWSIGTKSDSAAKGVKLNDIIIVGHSSSDTAKRVSSIRINGNTLYNKALVIIDGTEAKGINPLDNINPNDIESISVLKGASATVKYGDKGKDGAIEITTKKAKKP